MDQDSGEECAASVDEPPNIPRVDVVYLTYNCKRIRPTIALDNVCTVSLYELKKHRYMKRNQKTEMSAEAYQHCRWYNTVLSNLLKEKGGPVLLKVFHWYIESSNVDAFKVENTLYEAVSLIIAAHVEHWYCAKRGHSVYGSRLRLGSEKLGADSTERNKARIADCLVAPDTSLMAKVVDKKLNRRTRQLSLCTINEE
ncbi:uncharacterized protein LOC131693414 [Topomyia yanbarensis]|uniref:uncharacterized protein LOC131693414 n=1 Tax=Topomyia yanbarensis TaxID=2498891 RepID=UPI00273C1561|nr:uncharacterized protein LOC131693414 [Topomyia yanbarensis]